MIDTEMWAIKDIEKDKIVMTKWGRSLWLRKQSPNKVNIIGYRRFEGGNADLKPIKVKVTEIIDD
tara:strand:- start:256 stop:450 length:195 start_codon:yes stop_codon:yes gene_type:complete